MGSVNQPPSKKAVKAAVTAMEQKGFTIPDGMQMVISFAPAPNAAGNKQGGQKKGGGGQQKKGGSSNSGSSQKKGGTTRRGRGRGKKE